MLMRNVMSKTKILTKQVQSIELNIADALEEKLNLQIEAAVTFSAQHGVNAESEFAKYHRKRVAPRRIDDTPENTVHFNLGCKRFTEKSSCKCLAPKYYCLKIT